MRVATRFVAFIAMGSPLVGSASVTQAALKPGDTAPAFKLSASDGREYGLAQLRGERAVAVCWFPRAGSGGARIQCAALEAVMAAIPTDKVQVFGCSTAPLDVTTTFGQEGKYSFPVLSDFEETAAESYGCLRPDGLSERWTFLIDDQGVVLAVSKSITPQTQGTELVRMLVDAGLMDAEAGGAAVARAQLTPGSLFSVEFAEMPPTFYDVSKGQDVKAQMTVFIPSNYDAGRKHPLLIFLNGGDGGTGSNPGVARALTEDKDFVCVSVPLFKAPEGNGGDGGFIMDGPDGRYMWPFFRTMLAKLEELVPNIDAAHRILGGFSNGAHATAALIDQSDGEVAERFAAFVFVEGGGKLRRYDLLQGKPFLMVSSNAKSLPRAQEIRDAAKAAGAEAALVSADVGQHDFPASAYPAVRKWLRGVGLAAALATGDRQLSFQVDGQARTCILHLPPAYDGKRSLPLVIALHGAPGTGKGMADMTGFSDLADREGFIVAYPDGIAGKYGDSWNAAFGEPTPKEQGAQVQEVDDVGFMRALTGELRVSHHTDPARVYVCGHSAGGFMAYGVAIHLADRVAAVGVVNGSIGMNLVDGGTSVPDIPSPVAPIAVIHVCGAEDSTAKPGGGRSDKALVWSARDCTQFFAHADRCAVPGKDATDTAHGVSRTLYSGGMAGTEVQLTVVASCGHQWPTPLEGLSATQELWDFFAAHPKVAAP